MKAVLLVDASFGDMVTVGPRTTIVLGENGDEPTREAVKERKDVMFGTNVKAVAIPVEVVE